MMNSVQTGSPISKISADWGQEMYAGVCERCGWEFLLTSDEQLQRCPHCFLSKLSPYDPDLESFTVVSPPELIVPAEINQEILGLSLQTFSRGIWFAPQDLNPVNLQQRIERVFLPMWLVDVQVEATWQAEVGYDYQIVSHREQFDQNRGGWVSQEVTETRVRWEPRAGKLKRQYPNIVAPALEEHASILSQMGEFNFNKSHPYTHKAVEGWQIRLPDRSPQDAWQMAVPAVQSAAAEECRQAMSADHIRQYRWSAGYSGENWTLELLPILTTYYLDDENRPQVILIHGQTGKLSGKRQASMKRAQRVSLYILLAALVVFLIGLVVALMGLVFPPAVAIGGVAMVFASIITVTAAYPVGWVWQFNRRNS